MRKNILLLTLILFCGTSVEATQNNKQGLKLWYTTPADATVKDNSNAWVDDPEWLKSLPLGNGSLGAMIFGDVSLERI